MTVQLSFQVRPTAHPKIIKRWLSAFLKYNNEGNSLTVNISIPAKKNTTAKVRVRSKKFTIIEKMTATNFHKINTWFRMINISQHQLDKFKSQRPKNKSNFNNFVRGITWMTTPQSQHLKEQTNLSFWILMLLEMTWINFWLSQRTKKNCAKYWGYRGLTANKIQNKNSYSNRISINTKIKQVWLLKVPLHIKLLSLLKASRQARKIIKRCPISSESKEKYRLQRPKVFLLSHNNLRRMSTYQLLIMLALISKIQPPLGMSKN